MRHDGRMAVARDEALAEMLPVDNGVSRGVEWPPHDSRDPVAKKEASSCHDGTW